VNPKKLGIAGAAVAVAAMLAAGGASIATAAQSGQSGISVVADQAATEDQASQDQGGARGPGGHQHTAVTGDEATKVSDAVTAADSTITIDSIMKDPDGSYDVHATKDGTPVMVEVSADLASVEVRTDRGPGGPGGPGGHQHTAVTGDEATKVSDAVTIDSIMKDPDGSYDVHATKDGTPVMVEVSADLADIEVRTPPQHDGGQPPADAPSGPEQAPGQTPTS
jgi:hypothetical protein